jgi:alcohol dehydrogenase class IV
VTTGFEFATAGRIVFGAGTFDAVGSIAREFGPRAFVVSGRSPRFTDRLFAQLATARVTGANFVVAHEPTTTDVENAVEMARDAGCDVVIGLGGGSVIDAAKAISALLTNGGELADYLEVVGRAQPLNKLATPCIAIPTTAGTGAEVTRNAVLASPEHRVKVSLRSPLMLPRVALVDPELTHTLPPAITASTGLDALTQLIEPYVSSRANPLTDPLCVEGLRRVARSLRVAVDHGGNRDARQDMAVASLFGGLALANAGLGAVHGFAGPIGGAFPAPHGAVCAALLPSVTAMNLRALRARSPDHAALGRYDELGRLLTGDGQADASHAVRWLSELVAELDIPRLGAYGITRSDVPALVTAAARASSMKGNPIPLTAEECTEILVATL